jgi:hypothetical protein
VHDKPELPHRAVQVRLLLSARKTDDTFFVLHLPLQVKTWYVQYLIHRLYPAATPCSTPADNSCCVLQLPSQVKTWYVQYLICMIPKSHILQHTG